jgi:methylamine dehydrogenase accessory protein MauD
MTLWLLASNVLLLILVGGLGFLVLSLARQIGVLHERTAPLGLLRQAPGLKLGEIVPSLQAPNLFGRQVDLTQPALDGHALALLFVAPDCPVCSSVLPAFRTLTQSQTGTAPLAGYLVSDGTRVDDCRAYADSRDVDPRRYLISQALAVQMQVRLLPFLVVIDAEGRLRAQEAVQDSRALARVLSRLHLPQPGEPLPTH